MNKERKYCQDCRSTTKRLIKSSKNYYGTQYYRCNDCNSERARKYRDTPLGKHNAYKAVKKYEIKNSDKVSAWKKVRYYKLRKGNCEVCGDKNVHGHHPDYSKPLKVVWLCPLHHKEAHCEKLLSIV